MNVFDVAARQNDILRQRIALGLGIHGGIVCGGCQGMGFLSGSALNENYGYGALDENYGYGILPEDVMDEGGLQGGRRRRNGRRKPKRSAAQRRAVAYARRHRVSMPEAWQAIR